jgi:hypothetical protein
MAELPHFAELPPKGVETRWFTYENPGGGRGAGGQANHGRKGAACVELPSGDTLPLLDTTGPGVVRRIWITVTDINDPATLRGLKAEAYWDGAETPAVQAPLGDLFCHSLGRISPFENECFSSPQGRSFNSYVAMPFKRSARITLTNETDRPRVVFYELDCTVGEDLPGDIPYFHAYWRRERRTELRGNMAVLPRVEGRGRFLGCCLGVRVPEEFKRFWWGEGETKIYLDGDGAYPTLCGTGTEDYIGTGWGTGRFGERYQGNPYVSEDNLGFGFYRLHVPDPVYFHRDIRVDAQVLGGALFKDFAPAMAENPDTTFMKPGDGSEVYAKEEIDRLFEENPEGARLCELSLDYSAAAYWYMNAPENGLGPLAPVSERCTDLG